MTRVSTLGSELASIARLTRNQSDLATLTEQLSTGIRSADLTDYTTTEAKNLLDLNASMARKEAYLVSINLVDARISVYDAALTGVESLASNAVSLASTSSAYNSETNGTTATTIKNYLNEVEYYLNQKVSDRYIFSGTRYTTVPVASLTDLPVLTAADVATAGVVSTPTLPDYDSYLPTVTTSSAAYTEDSVTIDSTTKLAYGISSDDASFQKLILGLRIAYAATQDPANYATLMTQAQTYIQEGLNEVQAVHAGLTSDANTLNAVETRLTNDLSDIKNRMGDIQSVDTSETAVRITSLQTQMEAAFSATSKLITLSILKYL